MKWAPKRYQLEFVGRGTEQARLAAWLGMGLGKTSSAATIIQNRMDRGQVGRVLVVAPLRVCQLVWPQELEKWDHLSELPIRFIRGTAKQRKAQLDDSSWWGIDLVNYDVLAWLFTDYLRRGHRLPWQMVVFDESSKLKSVSTRRFRALRRWAAEFDYVLELTGSPAPSGYLNLWTQMFLLDQGASLGATFTAYRERWFESDFMGWKYTPKANAAREIEKRIRPLVLSMRTEDYLNLPPLTVNDVWVELPRSARGTYNVLEQEMFIRLERGEVEVANGGVLTGKCRQACNGFLYVDRRTDAWQELHDEKLRALQDIIEENDGRPLIVCYQFKADLHVLRHKFPHAGVLEKHPEPEKLFEQWNAGKLPMLLIHPQSAGHGLNLQGGADRMVFYGCPWSWDQYEQAIDRIAGGLRRGRPVFVHRILARASVDEDVVQALEEHREVQDVLKDRMRASLP